MSQAGELLERRHQDREVRVDPSVNSYSGFRDFVETLHEMHDARIDLEAGEVSYDVTPEELFEAVEEGSFLGNYDTGFLDRNTAWGVSDPLYDPEMKIFSSGFYVDVLENDARPPGMGNGTYGFSIRARIDGAEQEFLDSFADL